MTIPFTTYYHYGFFYWMVGIDADGDTEIIQYAEKFWQTWEVGEDAKLKQRQFLERHAERIMPELGQYVWDLLEKGMKEKRPKAA